MSENPYVTPWYANLPGGILPGQGTVFSEQRAVGNQLSGKIRPEPKPVVYFDGALAKWCIRNKHLTSQRERHTFNSIDSAVHYLTQRRRLGW